ncbi:amino acid adenylation domain-containing protein [Micromonospora echinofusca]|uniref:Amino acid adenylation domain-containing protein n=1 Tax=Micromonospora echinofusca TaxID=47858 RepID=A0ABS3W1F3_MICEH|nr:amino acid adenylation domain-containing protein [Micromonospora echinofusca]MBO4210622.1 amino acid adenylation domain-containing protein [Micromonospora echinofusca]
MTDVDRSAVPAPAGAARRPSGGRTTLGCRTFVDDIRDRADRQPDAPAIVTPETVLDYAALVDRIDRLAGRLAAVGVGPERVCAVALPRGVDAVVAMAAVVRAGGAFLTLDVDQPPERSAAMVTGARTGLLITDSTLAGRLDLPVPGPTVLLDRPYPGPDRRPAPRPVDPSSLAYVSHTSGSTGTPNAVLVEHRGVHDYLRFLVDDYGLDRDTVVVQVAPLGYDASIRDIFAPLVAGGRLVLVPRADLLRPDGFAQVVARFGGNTVLSATPSLLTALVRHADAARRLAGFRLVVTSGESLRPFLVAGGRSTLTGGLVNQYGPTECTMTSTRYHVPQPAETTRDLVGEPVDGVTVQLLDADLRPVPDGTVGAVHIGGAGVARGYCGRPALTADRFVPDPLGPPGSRMYRTGDLARRGPDGCLEYLGRADRQVKVRGYRVDPAEIEGALLGHPAVTAAVIVPETDEQGRTWLIAHVTGDLDGTTDAALRTHLARTLPYHMMPRRFVRTDRVPTTASGKIDRAALGAGRPTAPGGPA